MVLALDSTSQFTKEVVDLKISAKSFNKFASFKFNKLQVLTSLCHYNIKQVSLKELGISENHDIINLDFILLSGEKAKPFTCIMKSCSSLKIHILCWTIVLSK